MTRNDKNFNRCHHHELDRTNEFLERKVDFLEEKVDFLQGRVNDMEIDRRMHHFWREYRQCVTPFMRWGD